MNLAEVFPDAGLTDPGPEVVGLAYDDRSVECGTVFFCVPGLTRDGHDFAVGAVAGGACALVVERPLGLGVPEVVVDDVRRSMGPAASRFNGHPSRRLDVVGVTGTNGKTTTSWLVRGLLEGLGRSCGVVGTVATVVGGSELKAVRTTPEAIDLQSLLARMAESGDSAAAIEVSSHALDLGRVDGTEFAVGIFTNLTQDHLDFHGTMDAYWQAKRRLFTELEPRVSIVNVDDPRGAELASDIPGVTTVSVDGPADWTVSAVEVGPGGSSFRLTCSDGGFDVVSRLPGLFNVRNSVEAVAAVASLGYDTADALEVLSGLIGVPGRLEPVDLGQGFAVLVDYAHTPDSLENVLATARAVTDGRVICVVGCGGDRDRGKRPLMGGIAAELADVAILTSDNPRSEDPEAILAEMAAGAGGRCELVLDRREAIGRAVDSAQPGDVVLIAGKGHEQGQEFENGRVLPFDDRDVAAEALADRGWART